MRIHHASLIALRASYRSFRFDDCLVSLFVALVAAGRSADEPIDDGVGVSVELDGFAGF